MDCPNRNGCQIIIFAATFTLIAFCSPQFLYATIADCRLGYWAMDEGSGKKIISKDGVGYSGQISGIAEWVKEDDKNFLLFDGKSTKITIEDTGDFEILPFSLFFRVKGGTKGTVLSKWDVSKGMKAFVVGIDGEDRLAFAISKNGDDTAAIVRSSVKLKQGVWYICGAIADGTRLSVYINGLDQTTSSVPYGSYEGFAYKTAGSLVIGDSSWFGKLSGCILDLAIYKKALNIKEVMTLSERHSVAKKLGQFENLLYFSFGSPKYSELNNNDIDVIEFSPFNGIALRLIGAYEMPDIEFKNFQKAIELTKGRPVGKKIWPVVFFNYLYGSPASNRCSNSMNGQDSLNDFAKHVNGLDLYNEKGALTYLKKIVSLALKIAHENGSPGIFIDPEAYNCYDAYSITELAKRHGKSTTEIVSRLKDIGGEIADASSPIFPNAVFFFYIIDFGNEMADGFERSFVYIAEGILERAIKGSYELKVVDGWTGKYLYTSVADMEFQVNQALARKAPYLEKYPNLEISGVVAPFDSFDKLKYNSWIKKGLLSAYVQDRLEVQSSADFKPIYQYLFNNLKWVWVYGATEAMGSIFQGPELSPKFVKVIGDTIPTIKRLPREPVILKIN